MMHSAFYDNVIKIFEDSLKNILNGTVCEKLEELLNVAMDTLRSNKGMYIHNNDTEFNSCLFSCSRYFHR